MSPDALVVLAGVVLAAAVVVAVVRLEARRTRDRVDCFMRAAGIEVPVDAGTRSVSHESALAGSESRGVRDSEPLTSAERGNGRDADVERSLAGLAGIRAVREPDS